jgi:hypothetical protein
MMDEKTDPTARPARDYLLFALACLGFGIAAGGIVLASPFLALSGLLILLLAVTGFALAAEH